MSAYGFEAYEAVWNPEREKVEYKRIDPRTLKPCNCRKGFRCATCLGLIQDRDPGDEDESELA